MQADWLISASKTISFNIMRSKWRVYLFVSFTMYEYLNCASIKITLYNGRLEPTTQTESIKF